MLLFLRGLLSLTIFAGTLVLVLYLLGLNQARAIEAWPGLESPSFRLAPGETGTWEPDWPACPAHTRDSELVLVPCSPPREPASLSVQVVAETGKEDRWATYHGEWIGAPTEWMSKGVGQLPALVHPLLVSGNRVTRISWKVIDVDPALVGSSARLLLCADARRMKNADSFRTRLHAIFPLVLIVLACAALFAGSRIQAAARGHDALLAALRAALAASVFAGTFLAGVYVLSQWMLARLEDWPGIHGPSFELTQGQSGVWQPPWPQPLRNGWDWSELRLETATAVERPEVLEVLVGVDPLVQTGHGGDWIGSPTDWMFRGIGVLPVRLAHRPLILMDTLATRISWRVDRVEAPLVGSTARVVLGAPPMAVEHSKAVQAGLHQLMLPILFLLACMTFGIGWLIQERAEDRLRARTRERLHRRAPVTRGASS